MVEVDASEKKAAVPEDKTATAPENPERRRRIRWSVVGAAVPGVVLAVVFGVLWHSAAGDLAAERALEQDRQMALNTATEYTARSLTYDYRNLDAFFEGVDQGASQSLQDRYDGVREALTAIMNESQVVATGEVLSAAIDSESGGEYKVAVFAQQTTQNVQQPDPGNVPNLLLVTVTDQDGQWIVSDYGPKT
ncbi:MULTISPECIES: hypothetical protein [unclassified Rhodococcus (in: high G+C Gram-positive bacteria)]|uniref:hypothetical protein n=1 Tax=unclassified Rhodococcus (in: high G+C Gram-positive bacteria) TaxID=192944 RepID=UPI000B9A40A1|nr:MULTISPECIES: hypothetical protein [unclassified Rhodococcus (in: high G+C Gram-positive bacteria)]OZE32994.1 hypothetical protein CH259_21425 [Rhodococcus sp. 05-2254-4]OZE44111.1 hypothetical protein CH261_17230 [Rhodococcus sp. 05-2254-3]OZE44747.1 hypothetical protein CH256_01665 [Rhodococcus sp. 05-2254-6]OZE56207.1 hypothetical protein CH283_01690 [Rhodococcus sp. 05-2254-2]